MLTCETTPKSSKAQAKANISNKVSKVSKTAANTSKSVVVKAANVAQIMLTPPPSQKDQNLCLSSN